MITVMLVDDQELIRIGLKAVLSHDLEIEVVADLDNGLDALRQARVLRPDVVVVDVDMPELSGVEVTTRLVALSHPPQVIVLSVLTQPPWPKRLRAAGARLTGRHRPNPFFDAAGAPTVTPRILTLAERDAARPPKAP